MFKLIPLPYLIMVVVGILLMTFLFGGRVGYREASQYWQAKDASRVVAEQAAKIKADAITIQQQQTLANQKAALDAAYQKVKEYEDQRKETLRRAARTGDLRLYAKPASKPAAHQASNPASASGANDQARCELDPTTADDLISITSDGDAAIRQLTALQTYVSTICEGK